MRFIFPFRCTFMMESNNVIVQLAICSVKNTIELNEYSRKHRRMRNPGYRQHEQSSLFSSFFSQSVERNRSWKIFILVLVLTPTLTLFTRLNTADGSTITKETPHPIRIMRRSFEDYKNKFGTTW